jgi:osmotically inducible protein OsmC
VDLCSTSGDYSGKFSMQARLTVTMPGVDRALAQRVLDAAHSTCPYTEATRGNVDTTVRLA